MVDPAIFQIGSIKNMKEYCLVGLYTNFHNFSQMCKFNTLWSPTNNNVFPVNTANWPSVGLMLGQRRRRWSNIELVLGVCLVSHFFETMNNFVNTIAIVQDPTL